MIDKEKLHQILSSLWRNDDKDGKIYYNKALQDVQMAIDLQEEPVSGLDNGNMPVERWEQAVKAASNQRSYRSSKGLTETRDDYFVDGVQWADEHPKEEPASEDLMDATNNYCVNVRKGYPRVMDETDRYICNAFKAGAKWKKEHLWKSADGDDLPEIDREVIALLDNGKVVFAHRPSEYWNGKNIDTGKVTRYYSKTYGKGGWNIPDVKWWLDCSMPKEIEL